MTADDIGIREAQSGDLDALVALETAAFRSDRLSRRQFAAHVKSPTADLLVAHKGPEVTGYALVLTRRGSRVARLYSLAVAEGWKGRGIGSRLLAAAQARAANSNAASFRLEVRADNDHAIRFYEGRGYRLIGRKSEYYQDGAPALRYDLALNSQSAGWSSRRLGRAA